jgi:hypothetical protein
MGGEEEEMSGEGTDRWICRLSWAERQWVREKIGGVGRSI